MKKLTIEEKAKAYDEAIKKAESLYKASEPMSGCNVIIETLFHELAESEDERTRKGIIELVKQSSEVLDKQNQNNMIAWLEKQGKNIRLPKFTFDDVLALQCVMETVKKVQEDKELYEQLQSLHDRLHDAYWLEKQGEQKSADVEPDFFFDDFRRTDSEVESKFKVGDYIERKDGLGCHAKIIFVGGNVYGCEKLIYQENESPFFEFMFKNQDEFQISSDFKQNPADKVEPKFRNGQWIVWQDKCYKVNYNGCGYELVDQNGLSTSLEYGTVDENAHVFTIQDAKDGDVLYSIDSNRPFIYKERKLNEQATAYCGLNIYGKFFVWGTKDCVITLSNYVPATKEQRDLLFQKMKESGYEWMEETRELKKIDDEEVNGEDYGIDSLYHAQRILEKTLGNVEGYQSDDGILDHKAAITAVKKLYKRKPTDLEEFINELSKQFPDVSFAKLSRIAVRVAKWAKPTDEEMKELLRTEYEKGRADTIAEIQEPAWSEEDETFLNTTIAYLKDAKEFKKTAKNCITWLKSIKDRCTWKPSKEQMDALLFVVQHYTPKVTDKLAWDSIKILELMYYEIK